MIISAFINSIVISFTNRELINSRRIRILIENVLPRSIAMTVEWATTGMKMSPEQLADQLIDAMPPKLYDLFKDI